MYYLNTSRRLITPADDRTVQRLREMLEQEIIPKASTLSSMRSIAWMISLDRTRMEAFSGFTSADDLPGAEHSVQHRENSAVIADLLGGLTEPQRHTQFESIDERHFQRP